MRQLWFYNCFTCANYNFTIVILASIMILQLSLLRQFWFHNCYTCANYDFTFVRFGPIIILQSSYLRQLWFYICRNCACYYFTIVKLAPINYDFCANFTITLAPIIQYDCHTCANYDFTICLCTNLISQLLYLRQLWFYICHTCANYDFTIVILASIMILQKFHYDFTIIILLSNLRQFDYLPITILQLSYLRQLWFYNCHFCANFDFTIVILARILAPILISQLLYFMILHLSDLGQL